MPTAAHYKTALQLTRHVEGGWYAEVYRSALVLPHTVLTSAHHGDRNAMTSIYFLLESGDFSAFHRIASDEVWHHLDGGPLSVYEISPDGQLVIHLLGKDVNEGQRPMVVIKAGSWFGSRVATNTDFALCSCTVAPAFDFADFELASQSALIATYPEHESLILALTRP